MDDRYVEFNSVCMVLPPDGNYPKAIGKHTLIRIADIDNSGKIELFNREPNKRSKYENNLYIICDNGPSNPGAIGVWHWTAKPNTKNPENDYVKSNYIGKPIYKIIIDRDIIDIHQLVLKLNKGIQIDPLYSDNSIIYAYGEDDSYIGILLQKDNFEEEVDCFKLKNEVCKLKYYRIKIVDTCKYQDSVFNKEHVFLQSTVLPRFEDFIIIREVEEYISKLFFNSLRWNDMKNELVKKDIEFNPQLDIIENLNQKLTYALAEDRITVPVYKKFQDYTQWLMPFETILLPNHTDGVLNSPKLIDKKKTELLNKK